MVRGAAAIALLVGGCLGLAAEAELVPARYTNRLIDSANPYLLLHAHNPVDWYPWGPEAFEKARREGKPIFVSVGYSTCYWCHVAEKTLYSDPAIAKLMNEGFVNIKVDREERPDVDGIYMMATVLMTGHGGWPNNVFLTPDLRPFFGGSYFPPEDDAFGRPGFATLLKAIRKQWAEAQQTLIDQGDRVYAAMKQAREQPAGGPVAAIDPKDWMKRARIKLRAVEDRQQGGIGKAQKFPQEPILGLLLADYRLNGESETLAQLRRALDAMAFGGIHDHVGGGFHRYTVEPTWSIPHFEKMLYNNAQLLGLYAQTYETTKDPLYRDIANDIARYLGRRMKSSEGGFFTAEDAEVDGEEGSSYLWSGREIEAVLGGADAARFLEIYAISPLSRSAVAEFKGDEGRGVLRVRSPLSGRLASVSRGALAEALSRMEPLRVKLLAARDRRAQPGRDDKIVASLNGLAIEALAKAGGILARPEYLAWARAAGDHVWKAAHDSKSGNLKHQMFRGQARIEAYLDDFALLGLGFLALADATKEPAWRSRAEALADAMLARFGRRDGSLASSTDTSLVLAGDDEGDNVTPAGSSAALALLDRLSVSSLRYREAAARLLRANAARVGAGPEHWSYLVSVASRISPNATGATLASLDTAAHAKASGTLQQNGEFDELVVTLTIDKGYHVNANPASLENLIPTTLELSDVSDARIRYPKPVEFKPAFAAQPISVYEGEARIQAIAPKGQFERAKLVIRAQACDDQICLPPADIPVDFARHMGKK